jgi:hypothetical protein
MSESAQTPAPRTPEEFHEWLQGQLGCLPTSTKAQGHATWAAAYDHAARLGAANLLRTVRRPSAVGFLYYVHRGVWREELEARLSRLIGWTTTARRPDGRSEPSELPASNIDPPFAAGAPRSGNQKRVKKGEAREKHIAAILRVLTNGVSDDRIKMAAEVLLNVQLSMNETLTKIDALIPFPPTASAEQLAKMLGVTKQAVLKTGWWTRHRRGKKEENVGRRREAHRARAAEFKPLGTNGEGEPR